jgi:hypothetical protein
MRHIMTKDFDAARTERVKQHMKVEKQQFNSS